MNKPLLVALLVSTLLSQTGCRRQRVSHKTAQPRPTADTVATVKPTPGSITTAPADSTALPTPVRPGIEEARANVAEIDFRFLTAKSKLSFQNKTQDISNANLNLRVRKDSLIWVSVSKIGIEAVRILITRDSVRILDKLERQFAVYDFPTLSRQFNFEMNFELLQALIVGNLPLPKRPAQKLRNERDYLLLRQDAGKVLVENYIGTNDRKLKKILLTEQPTKNALRLDYEDFTSLNNFLFPYSSLVTLDYKSNADGQFYQTLIKIKHNKVELVEKNPGFPFTIPANYRRN